MNFLERVSINTLVAKTLNKVTVVSQKIRLPHEASYMRLDSGGFYKRFILVMIFFSAHQKFTRVPKVKKMKWMNLQMFPKQDFSTAHQKQRFCPQKDEAVPTPVAASLRCPS